jgi:hypothetical protein
MRAPLHTHREPLAPLFKEPPPRSSRVISSRCRGV